METDVLQLEKDIVLFSKYDAVYAVTHTGLELLIFMRALGLFRNYSDLASYGSGSSRESY